MRTTLRTFRPDAVLGSFLGVLDIKLGCEIILLFGLINKVAGVYGLITLVVGGTYLQYLFYAYSIATLFAYLWALSVVKSETSKPTLLIAHLYTLDHILVTLMHYGFFTTYWNLPHDGQRVINSEAQQALIDLAVSRGEVDDPRGTTEMPGERARIGRMVWSDERGFAVGLLVLGFAVKVYFILTLYSYAAHLRNSTYHQLPRTARSKASQLAHPNTPGDVQVLHEMQDELEDELAEAEAEAEAEASANGQAAKSQEIRKGSYGASRSTVTSDSIGKGKGKGKGEQRDEGI